MDSRLPWTWVEKPGWVPYAWVEKPGGGSRGVLFPLAWVQKPGDPLLWVQKPGDIDSPGWVEKTGGGGFELHDPTELSF